MKKILILLLTLTFYVSASAAPKLSSLKKLPSVTFHTLNTKGAVKHIEGKLSASVPNGNEISESYAFLEEHKEAFDLASPTEELQVDNFFDDNLGFTHVKFNQTYEGLKVYGGQLFTHYNTNNELKTVTAKLIDNISLSPTPTISSYTAVQTAQSDLESFFGKSTDSTPELLVYPFEDENYLAYRVVLYSDIPMGRWEYFVDANTNEVIFKANRIMDSDEIGTGIGVTGNAYTHIDTELLDTTYYLRDNSRQAANDPHGHGGLMTPGSQIITRISGASLPGSIAFDYDNIWASGQQPPAVDGHVYTGLYYDWLLSALGRNGYTDGGGTMNVSVEYTAEGLNNAYWNGSRIVVWGASSGYRSLAGSPDVIAHEWAHAVTEYCSNLIYQKESGALNESFSDMMGAAFEFAIPEYDNPDWNMGENISIASSGFRSLQFPHSHGDPDTYGPTDIYWQDVINCTPSNGNDWCGVHTNSGVGNKWFFLLSDGGTHNGIIVDGIGVENAMKVAYRANLAYWTSTSTYQEAADGTISAANDLDPTYQWTIQVSKAWEAVGVDVINPEIYITVDTTYGWVPLTVNFEGNSVLNVTSWDWEFGDGDVASIQSPTHVYDSAGLYDVTLEIDADGDLKSLTQNGFIIALADTVKSDSVETEAGASLMIPIIINNTIPLNQIDIPITYGGDFLITFDSLNTTGCRTDYFDNNNYLNYDAFNKRLTYRLKTNPLNGTPDLPVGSGPVLNIFVTINPSASGGQVNLIDFSGYNIYLPTFTGPQLSYTAAANNGILAITACLLRGDFSDNGEIDIEDLVALVDYSFNGGPPPSNLGLADVNCSEDINIGDIVHLVEFMFNSGPPPCGC